MDVVCKIKVIFIFVIVLCIPSLLFAQAKPKRDVTKDIQKVKKQEYKPQSQKTVITIKPKSSVKQSVKNVAKIKSFRNYRVNRKKQQKTATYLTTNIKNTSLSPFGGKDTVVVNTDGRTWDVYGVPSWCEVIKNKDNKSFVLSYQQNAEHYDRESFISIIADEKISKVKIHQLGTPINITYSINSAQLLHNETYGSKTKYLRLNANITITGAKGCMCYAVATVKDGLGKIIETAYNSQMIYPVNGEFVITRKKIVPSTDDSESFNIDLSLPNDVMFLTEKQNYLVCNLYVICEKSVESINGNETSLHFKATKKRRSIVTSCLTEKEVNTISYQTVTQGDNTSIKDNNNIKTMPKGVFISHARKNVVTNKSYASDFNFDDYLDFVDELPSFPDGYANLIAWIEQNSKLYECEDDFMVNRVTIQLYVDDDGTVHNPKIISGGNKKVEKEILRIVPLMPKWNPGKKDGNPVKCKICLPILISQ